MDLLFQVISFIAILHIFSLSDQVAKSHAMLLVTALFIIRRYSHSLQIPFQLDQSSTTTTARPRRQRSNLPPGLKTRLRQPCIHTSTPRPNTPRPMFPNLRPHPLQHRTSQHDHLIQLPLLIQHLHTESHLPLLKTPHLDPRVTDPFIISLHALEGEGRDVGGSVYSMC